MSTVIPTKFEEILCICLVSASTPRTCCSVLRRIVNKSFNLICERSTHRQGNWLFVKVQIMVLGLAGEWGRLAPFRILSLDIECAGRKVQLPPSAASAVHGHSLSCCSVIKLLAASFLLCVYIFGRWLSMYICGRAAGAFSRCQARSCDSDSQHGNNPGRKQPHCAKRHDASILCSYCGG